MTGVSQQDTPAGAVPSNVISGGTIDNAEAKLHFVVSSNLEKPDTELRKFIRSHVMRGKNQGRKLPLRKKKPKAGQEIPSSSFDASAKGIHGSFALPSTAFVPNPVPAVTIPRSFGSGMSTISFADALEPGTIEVVLQCGLFLACVHTNTKY
jgi:hypothetical protein